MWHDFRWIDWNLEKIARHGLSTDEVEFVVNNPIPPYPRKEGEKSIVAGPTRSGLWIQVIYVFDPDGRIFVIHSRSLDTEESRKAQRRIREARG